MKLLVILCLVTVAFGASFKGTSHWGLSRWHRASLLNKHVKNEMDPAMTPALPMPIDPSMVMERLKEILTKHGLAVPETELGEDVREMVEAVAQGLPDGLLKLVKDLAPLISSKREQIVDLVEQVVKLASPPMPGSGPGNPMPGSGQGNPCGNPTGLMVDRCEIGETIVSMVVKMMQMGLLPAPANGMGPDIVAILAKLEEMAAADKTIIHQLIAEGPGSRDEIVQALANLNLDQTQLDALKSEIEAFAESHGIEMETSGASNPIPRAYWHLMPKAWHHRI